MNFRCVAAICVHFISLIEASKLTFIKDYFSDKTCAVTAHACWNYAESRKFLTESLKSSHQRQISLYRNETTNMEAFFRYMDVNNCFLIDMENCKSSWNLFKFASENNMLRLFQRYLLIVNEEDFTDFLEEIKTYNLFVNNEVWVARRGSTDYELFSPYKIKNDTEMILEYGGGWSQGSGWKRMEKLLATSTRRKDLGFLPFKFGIVLDDLDTLNHLYDFRYPEIDLFSKQTIGPIHNLFDYCNMSITLVRTPTYGYYLEESDSWNGLIGQIMSGEVDFGGSAMVLSTSRLSVVDFLNMVNPLEVIFVYRKAPLSNVKNIFFVSFKRQLWYALFGLLGILGIGFYLVLKFAVIHKLEIVKDKYTVWDAVLLDLEMLCQQGTMFEPRSLSYQILMFFGITALMVIYISYSANIIVLLQTTKKFDSIHDLYNSRFRVSAHNTSYMKFILSGSRDKFLNQFYEVKIGLDSPFLSKEDSVEKLRQGGTAIFGEVLILYNLATKYYTERELCSLQEMIGFVRTGIGYSPIPKGSPFRKLFRIGMHKILENGLHRRHFNRLTKKPQCSGEIIAFESVGIYDIQQAIIIFLYGTLIAVFIFIFELVRSRVKKRKITISEQCKRCRILGNCIGEKSC